MEQESEWIWYPQATQKLEDKGETPLKLMENPSRLGSLHFNLRNRIKVPNVISHVEKLTSHGLFSRRPYQRMVKMRKYTEEEEDICFQNEETQHRKQENL